MKRTLRILDTAGKKLVEESFNDTTDDDDYINEIKSFVNSVETLSEPQVSGYSALVSLEQAISARQKSGLP